MLAILVWDTEVKVKSYKEREELTASKAYDLMLDQSSNYCPTEVIPLPDDNLEEAKKCLSEYGFYVAPTQSGRTYHVAFAAIHDWDDDEEEYGDVWEFSHA